MRNCLAIQLNDHQLAADVYADLKEQVLRAPERARNTEVSVALAPWKDGPATGKASMFVATVHWEYRTVPRQPILRFACTSDLDEYREHLQDPAMTNAWYFEPIAGLDGSSKEVYEQVPRFLDQEYVKALYHRVVR